MKSSAPETFPFRLVLDLYAGTGALGIEALSRGALHVDFVETSPQARATIQDNLRRTGFAGQGTLHSFPSERAPSIFREPYDLILIDPPYNDPGIPALLEALGRSQLLAEGGVLVLEHARTFQVPGQIDALLLDRVRYHGTTALSLYRRATPECPPPDREAGPSRKWG